MTGFPIFLERAYELARQGKTLTQIKAGLRCEGFTNIDAQLYGPTLLASLRRLRAEAS